jgi:aspartyl protease family protein
MGYARVKAVVANPSERIRRREVELLADTGAIYTMLPESMLRALDIAPSGKRRFRIAGGEVKEYPTGEAYLEVEGIGATSVVVFGAEDSTPLLGVTTLELLGLQVDPVTGRLKPMELPLL